MSTEQRQNILLSYEQIPDRLDFYFIPSDSMLPLTLLHAIMRLDQVFVNHTHKGPVSGRGDLDAAYLQAALCTDQANLDPQNEYNENRFFSILEDYKIDPDQPAVISAVGPTVLIRTGFLM